MRAPDLFLAGSPACGLTETARDRHDGAQHCGLPGKSRRQWRVGVVVPAKPISWRPARVQSRTTRLSSLSAMLVSSCTCFIVVVISESSAGTLLQTKRNNSLRCSGGHARGTGPRSPTGIRSARRRAFRNCLNPRTRSRDWWEITVLCSHAGEITTRGTVPLNALRSRIDYFITSSQKTASASQRATTRPPSPATTATPLISLGALVPCRMGDHDA
jgi:hypothetical protein